MRGVMPKVNIMMSHLNNVRNVSIVYLKKSKVRGKAKESEK